MKDLIEALQIFLKYLPEGSYYYNNPTNCEHDELRIGVDPQIVTDEDLLKLEKLGFHMDQDNKDFYSYKFGSY